MALARRIKYLSLCESCSICTCDRGCYWITYHRKKKKRLGRLIRFFSFSWENLISILISLTRDSTGVIFASKEQQYLFYVLWRWRPLEGPLTLNCLCQTHISCLPAQIAEMHEETQYIVLCNVGIKFRFLDLLQMPTTRVAKVQFLVSTTTFTTYIESKQDKRKVVFVRDTRKKRDKVSR